ncbi:MAG: FMN-binding protein [Acidimicrobiales bacterium]
MRRSGVVAVITVAGLAALMIYHTKPATLSLSGLGATSSSLATTTTTDGATSSRSGRGAAGSTTTTAQVKAPTTPSTTSGTSVPSTTTTSVPPTTTTTAPAAITRTVTGSLENYGYGTLSVSVTGSSSHVTKVDIASISDGGDSRSVSIDEYAIPILESQALTAQSANIQGVSGASYTSVGFEQSLQSALMKLRKA